MNDAAKAIVAKIRLLYERERDDERDGGRFVAFHPLASPMTPADLQFLSHESDDDEGRSPQERQHAAADFATLVNNIPDVDPVWMHDGRLLWREYRELFNVVEIADVELSDAERRTLEEAYDLLYDADDDDADIADGIGPSGRTSSAAYEAYRRHERRYQELREAHAAARITANHAEDPDVRAEAEAERDALEARIDTARRDWVTDGHRDEIESAIDDIDRLTGRGPRRQWREWSAQFRDFGPETDLLHDREFYPTGYRPIGFYRDDESNGWTTVELDGSEVRALLDGATDDPMTDVASSLLAGGPQLELDIDRLSVELARVDLNRAWFDPNLLRSRTWRWLHDREPLSDGGDPPRGRLPAYATSLLFARNLEIELTADSDRNERAIESVEPGDLAAFGPLLVEPPQAMEEAEPVSRLHAASFSPDETKALRELSAGAVTAKSAGREESGMDTIDEASEGIEDVEAADSDTVSVAVSDPTVFDGRPGLATLASISTGRTVRTASDGRDETAVATATTEPAEPTLVVERLSRADDRSEESMRQQQQRQQEMLHDPTAEDDSGTGAPMEPVSPRNAVKWRSLDEVVEESAGEAHLAVMAQVDGRVFERRQDGTKGPPLDSAAVTFHNVQRRIDFDREPTVVTEADGTFSTSLTAGRYVLTARRDEYVDLTNEAAPETVAIVAVSPAGTSLAIGLTPETVETWETMQLLAFVCQQVPKAPNPDPSLTWSRSDGGDS